MLMDPNTLVERLRSAVDTHDVEAVVACFAPGYRNETPAHPDRGFEGHEQVRTNWTRLFAGIPDISATVLRTALDGPVVWTEWELGGHRPDGVQQVLRGVIIFGTDAVGFEWARFYLEPVEADGADVDAAVGSIVETER